MQNVQTLKLSRATLMFPLALVLFEFAVYLGNDLIQPAMLGVTRDFFEQVWTMKALLRMDVFLIRVIA